MVAIQVMAPNLAVGPGGAGGHPEKNVYKPLIINNIHSPLTLIINNIIHPLTLIIDSCSHFRTCLVEGSQPSGKKIAELVNNSTLLVTALSPVIGCDKAS